MGALFGLLYVRRAQARTSETLAATRSANEELKRSYEQLRVALEQVINASITVSEAVAQIPEVSLQIALKTIALQAQTLTGAEYAALGIGTDPERRSHR
jgi:hypothetical protein